MQERISPAQRKVITNYLTKLYEALVNIITDITPDKPLTHAAKSKKKLSKTNEEKILEPPDLTDATKDMKSSGNVSDLMDILRHLKKKIENLLENTNNRNIIGDIKAVVSHLESINYYLWYFNKDSASVNNVQNIISPLIKQGNTLLETYPEPSKVVNEEKKALQQQARLQIN